MAQGIVQTDRQRRIADRVHGWRIEMVDAPSRVSKEYADLSKSPIAGLVLPKNKEDDSKPKAEAEKVKKCLLYDFHPFEYDRCMPCPMNEDDKPLTETDKLLMPVNLRHVRQPRSDVYLYPRDMLLLRGGSSEYVHQMWLKLQQDFDLCSLD